MSDKVGRIVMATKFCFLTRIFRVPAGGASLSVLHVIGNFRERAVVPQFRGLLVRF